MQHFLLALSLMIGALSSLSASTLQVKTNVFENANGTSEPCPYPWFVRNTSSHECECGPDIPGVLQCHQKTRQVWLKVLYCMTYDNTTGTTVVGGCAFGTLHKVGSLHFLAGADYVLLPKYVAELNDDMCGPLNRDGLLCSKCKSGYGPSVLSFQRKCTKCSLEVYVVLLMYIFFAFVPTTVLFLIMLFCKVRTTSAPLNFFIFASQLISIRISQNAQVYSGYTGAKGILVGIVISSFGIWNLDFFRYFMPLSCFSDSLVELHVLCMEYIVAFYPLVLVAFLYICIQQHVRGCKVLVCLWRPFSYCFAPLVRRPTWNPSNSLIHIFASFLLLSSSKILFVSADLLRVVQMHTLQCRNESIDLQSSYDRLLYDPSISIFSKPHVPYAILALCVPTVFVILPCLALILYPTKCFQKCLIYCRIRWHALQAFSDAFSGCYKDGTNGTRDCRSFAGFYLALHIVYVFSTSIDLYLWLHTVTFIVGLVLMAVVRPYKNNLFNALDISFITIAAPLFIAPKKFFGVIALVAVSTLLSYFIMFITCKTILSVKCRCSRKLKDFADKVFLNSVSRHCEGAANDSDTDDILQSRLTNPERYTCRSLSEMSEEQCSLLSNRSNNVPTYGI